MGRTYLRRTLAQVVDDRLQGRVAADDFLGTLIHALQERFSPEKARALAIDNAATFYLAGHETTANALSWTLFLLSEQPGLQDELAAEASAMLGVGGWEARPLTAQLPRLHAFLQEALRLYPPVPRFDRQALGSDRLGDAIINPGDIVSIWPWLLHRHHSLWDEPDAFLPDRFLRSPPRHRFQYLPFGGGVRICVGAQFATSEALTMLAHWLTQWRFVSTGQAVRVSGLVTNRPHGGLRLRLERR
jgi:cytochrome P450